MYNKTSWFHIDGLKFQNFTNESENWRAVDERSLNAGNGRKIFIFIHFLMEENSSEKNVRTDTF